VDLPDGLLEMATRRRLERALTGGDESRRLALGDLQPGDAGVIEAVVRQVHPVRPYQRTRGGTGLIGKVTVADTTGEAVIVLWDDDTQALREDGPFQPGAALRIQGATVRAGRRGGVELALGSAVVTPIEAEARPTTDLAGTLLAIGPTRVVGAPPRLRFQADVQVEAAGGTANLVVEGDLVKSLRALLPGAPILLEGVAPHPLLDGWWLAGPGTRLGGSGRNPK
jgi:hypothetical protein